MNKRRRITPAAGRRLALTLPQVYESSHFDRPDFRVRGKIFATLRSHARAVILETTPANLDALVSADAATFWDEWRGRWVGVRLNRVSLPLLSDLLTDAWRLAAPKRLAAAFRPSRTTPRRLTRA